jgi:oxaloacetate decarboxylase alpha subunit
MGIQSVLNIVTGDRYSMVPDEVIIYTLGHLGEPPAPIDPDVRDRVLSSSRAQEYLNWQPPQPSLKELRVQFGDERMSDEELLSRYLVPAEDFEATQAAGRVKPTYTFRDSAASMQLVEQALRMRRPGYVRVRRGDVDLTLRRHQSG